MMNTARFGLPLLAVAQAQKEVTHNEALTLIDALVQPTVIDGPVVAVPVGPQPGQCWLVGSGATGEWAAQDGKMAVSTDGGWRFAAPTPGMRVVRQADGKVLRFDGFGWIAPPNIVGPSGGSVIDTEGRAAIAAVIVALAEQGWLDSP